MKKPLLFTFLTAAGLTLGLLAFSQSAPDPLDSLKVCASTQKLIFENQFVRVIDNTVPVGETEPLHRHPHGVVVYLSDGKNETVTQDGKKSISEHKADTAVWSEPTVHSITNIGAAPTHTIRIDIKY